MADGDFEQWAAEELTHLRQGLTLRAPSRYQSIFKYIGLDSDRSWDLLEKSLTELCLEGSTCLELNDPFEGSPTVFDDLDAHRIAAATQYRNRFSWTEKVTPRPLPEVFPDATPYREAARKYLEESRAESRIVAFCERPDSGLLWSHYASSYRGACLHFLAGAFAFNRCTFGYVNYSRHRPIYPLSLALSLSKNPDSKFGGAYDQTLSKRAESEKFLFFTKAIEWEYETELRLVYRPGNNRPIAKFEGRSLLSIITGPRMDDKAKARLSEIVRRSALSDLVIRPARLSSTSFSVEIE